jgi:hypothetical protein
VVVPRYGAGYERVTARFGVCVYDVEAYVEPGSGDYQAFSSVRRGRVHAGRAVGLELDFSGADETGTWFVTSVTAFACRTGQVVQLDGGLSFRVVGK